MMKKGMTKKIIAAALALTLSMSMGGLVYAEESNAVVPQVSPAQIKATYQEGNVTTGLTYHVEVEWGSLEYTYHSGITKKWSPEKLKYVEEKGTASWTCEEGANQITVTNNSNADIKATLSYEATNGSGIKGSFDTEKINLQSAEYNTDSKDTATLKLRNALSESATEKTKVGEVTVTIKDYTGENSDYRSRVANSNDKSEYNFRRTLTENIYIATYTSSKASYENAGFYIIGSDTSRKMYLDRDITSAGTYSLVQSDEVYGFKLSSDMEGKKLRLTLDMRDEDNPTLMVQII